MNAASSTQMKRSLAYAVLVGIGVMAGVDEIVFHQILQWHHFYDLSTPTISILSDGLLYASELLAVVAGFFLLADLARQGGLETRRVGGFFPRRGRIPEVRWYRQPQDPATGSDPI